jgi:hypothetical protein
MDSRPTHFSSIQTGPSKEGYSGTGGNVKVFIGAGQLTVGQPVFFSDVNTVNVSATAANYSRYAGVVVGGKRTDMRVLHDTSHVGVIACAAGEDVIVQIDGIAWVVANVAVAITDSVIMSASSGKVTPGTTANQILGTPVTTAASPNDKIKILINHR